MKPFFHDKIFFYATEEELQTLRRCVANERWKFDEFKESREFIELDQLYKDLTDIVERMPF